MEKHELDALIEKAKSDEIDRQAAEERNWIVVWQREYDLIQKARAVLAAAEDDDNLLRPYYIEPVEEHRKARKEFGKLRTRAEESCGQVQRTLKKRGILEAYVRARTPDRDSALFPRLSFNGTRPSPLQAPNRASDEPAPVEVEDEGDDTGVDE